MTLNTPAAVLDGALAALRESEIRLIGDIAETLAEMGESAQDDRQRLKDLGNDLRDLFFLVVVIGEFNAGKSTFINALIGDELLPTGITPTTEMIELVRYADAPQRKPTVRDDAIREWAHPDTGAPGVALVDTPGTGSVFQKHEKIAKTFLHRSDLVIFLISAKRAFGETERQYMELARQYAKKIILVVNQVDLLSPGERTDVRRFVERQVDELIGIRPLIFMVSAREALNAKKVGLPSAHESGADGIDAVRAHLRGVFAEAPPAKQKLLAQLDLAERIVRKYADNVRGKADLVMVDTAKVRDLQSELEKQSAGLTAQLKGARADIDLVFNGLKTRGMNFISENLSPRRLVRPVNRDVLQAEFQDVVIGRALRDINEASGEYVNALVDQSRMYWRSIIDRLNQLRDLMEQELKGMDSGVYAEQREALQEAISIAEAELKSYSTGQVVDHLDDVFRANMSNFTSSAIAALVGLVVSAVAIATPGGVMAFPFVLPALILGAPLAAGGSYLAFRYWRRISRETKAELSQRIELLQKAYHDALDSLTQRERNRLLQYGNQVLTPFFSRLDVLAAKYREQQQALKSHLEQIEMLRKGIEEL